MAGGDSAVQYDKSAGLPQTIENIQLPPTSIPLPVPPPTGQMPTQLPPGIEIKFKEKLLVIVLVEN